MLRTTFLVIALLTLAPIAHGQASRCKVGSTRFICPTGMKLAHKDAVLEVFTRPDVAIFVTPAEGDVDIQLLASDIVKTSVGILYPKESQKFDWKSLPPIKSHSKLESDREGGQGFNGFLLVAFDYRIVNLKSAQLMVGYVASLGRDDAKATFERNLPAESVATLAGCKLTTKLVYSLTGQKFDAVHSPCSLNVRSAKVSFISRTQSPD